MNKLLIAGISFVALVSLIVVSVPNSIFTAFGPGEGELSQITLPQGFSIEVFADVPGARSLEYVNETLFVGTRDDTVYAVTDGEVRTVLEGLTSPNGVAVKNGDLYVAEIHRLLRYDDIITQLDDPGEPVVIREFPDERSHGWKFIRIDGSRVYVPVGAPCNICDPDEPFATITRMDLDGSAYEIYARGVRNTVGFDFHPETGDLWFTDNGRDWLGDNRPPDELNHAPRSGMDFGYPHCHGEDIEDPEFGQDCSAFTPPVVELGPHVAALRMRFYPRTIFPESYRGMILIAEHGSWHRDVPIGYRVMIVDPKEGTYEPFATGWLQGSKSWGRPVDVEMMPDGSLLISDDKAGKVYRVAYAG